MFKIIEKIKQSFRESKRYECPACRYLGLVYHGDGTAGCALCGVEFYDPVFVNELYNRPNPAVKEDLRCKITVSLPTEALARLNRLARERKTTRSGVIAELVREN